ncbi:hypothetical protein [Bacillus sp. NEB1478]|uniref:hypothetical protein n=1 Tax=Bacillus sp. NEB1478 TaxID=3073816 RepID=UPI002873AD35|nr:hypothetical protein [Bacillus sp. NEB1478]WNB92522.1 hypothetical protein RGB74_02315 [Bacillus sp. NEB1478]
MKKLLAGIALSLTVVGTGTYGFLLIKEGPSFNLSEANDPTPIIKPIPSDIQDFKVAEAIDPTPIIKQNF